MNTQSLRPSPWLRSWPSWRSSPSPSRPISNGATATRSRSAEPATDLGRRSDVGVRVAGIRKSYGPDSAAVDGVDLTIEAGELVALLGPSGSGKTTLLRVIAGLEVPEQGRVHFGGADVTDLPVQERRIGFVFQHYALFRHLTVADNVAYGLRARRTARPDEGTIRRRVADLLDLVQLDGLGSRYPAQLSGGQRQRVALARALAPDPRVLLLDEPFGALDARVRKDLRRWLKDIHRETGRTTIFVTHDQDEALELADRVAIINRGRLEQVGSADQIHDDPASPFVMSFVGESLRLPVRVAAGTVSVAGRILPVDAAGRPDGESELFLRPHDLALSDHGSGDLSGRVRAVRRAGRGHRADIRLDLGDADLEIEVGRHAPSVGDRVFLAVEGGRLFDRAIGGA